MEKTWKEIGGNNYTFYKDGQEIGRLDINPHRKESKAFITIGNEVLAIVEGGVWKKNVQIMNSKGDKLLELVQQKWYSNTRTVDHKGYTYSLEVRNNPMVEFVLLDQGNILLSYGLKQVGSQVGPTIFSRSEKSDPLLDFLLWYLMLPTIEESMAGNVDFFLSI